MLIVKKFSFNRYGVKLTISRKVAKTLTVSPKNHYFTAALKQTM